jgi:hypothetical protein
MLDITAERLAHLFYIWISAEDPGSCFRFSIVLSVPLGQCSNSTSNQIHNCRLCPTVGICTGSANLSYILHLLGIIYIYWNLWACPNNEDLWHITKEHGRSFTQEQVVINYYIHLYRLPLWSSGQSSWLQIRRPRFDSRHYQKKKVVGLERGPLSLVSTTEELLDRKVVAPV